MGRAPLGHAPPRAQVFPTVDYAFTTIPTYPSGQIGFLLCSTSPNVVLREPSRAPPPALQQQLRYYSPAVHAAAFAPGRDSNLAPAESERGG